MPLIRCPDCEKMVSSLAAACPNCAYPISTMGLIQCPDCKKMASRRDTACPNCGHPPNEVNSSKQVGSQPQANSAVASPMSRMNPPGEGVLEEITDDQRRFLAKHLQSSEKNTYFISRPILDYLRERGADADLLNLLSSKLGEDYEMEISCGEDEPRYESARPQSPPSSELSDSTTPRHQLVNSHTQAQEPQRLHVGDISFPPSFRSMQRVTLLQGMSRRGAALNCKRPVSITVVCRIAFVIWTLGFLGLLASRGASAIDWLCHFAELTGIVGLWRMKKWGLWTYSAAIGVNLLDTLRLGISLGATIAPLGIPLWVEYIFPAIVIVIGSLNYSKLQAESLAGKGQSTKG